jgi:4-amino-4-deoxy-L-arabinose transferase-like glycosyltransferase
MNTNSSVAFTRQLPLILCLWLAFLLRVWGLGFGLPFEFHPDENQYVDAALTWHTSGQWQLSLINPPLFTYVLTAAYGLWLALSPYAASPEWVSSAYFYARFWSAGFGLLTVPLVYALGRRLYHRQAGLLAMLLMAGLFLPAREAHFAVNDTLAAFLTTLAIYFSLLLWRARHWQIYLKTGLVVGLATSAKLTGGLVTLALLAAHLLAPPSTSSSRFWLRLKPHRYLLLAGLAALLVFMLVSGHILWRLPEFAETIGEHLHFGAEGYKGLRMAPASGWQFYLEVLGWGIGWLLLLVVLVALGFALWQRRSATIMLIIFSLALFVYMGSQKILFARFILPAIPPLLIVAVGELAQFGRRWSGLSWGQAIWAVIIITLLAQPLANLVWFDHLLTLPDTRELATAWFMVQFPEDTVVAREGYSILPTMLFLPHHWPYKMLYLDERGPTRNNLDHYVSYKTQVITLSNFTYGRARAGQAEEMARQQQLAYLEEKATLIKEFNPYRPPAELAWFYMDQLYGPAGEVWQRLGPGPLIKIYRLPYENQPYRLEAPAISTPVEANFAGKLTLLGYDLANRRAEPGGVIPLTLYWRAETRLYETYVVSNRLLDSQQRSWGGYDRWPQETANTRLWHPGEVVVDAFNLPVDPAAPPGIYTIDIGLYDQADSTAAPLPLVRAGRPLNQNSVRMGPLKVGGPPPGRILSPQVLKPRTKIAVTLGVPPVISLRGFDLLQSDETWDITLYWESLAQTSLDWSIFVHLRNQAGETVAQKDGPAGGGESPYPTSLWDVGEIIADKITLSLPPELPAGRYTLVVGLYNLADGTRLDVPNSLNNEINLTTQELTRP